CGGQADRTRGRDDRGAGVDIATGREVELAAEGDLRRWRLRRRYLCKRQVIARNDRRVLVARRRNTTRVDGHVVLRGQFAVAAISAHFAARGNADRLIPLHGECIAADPDVASVDRKRARRRSGRWGSERKRAATLETQRISSDSGTVGGAAVVLDSSATQRQL